MPERPKVALNCLPPGIRHRQTTWFPIPRTLPRPTVWERIISGSPNRAAGQEESEIRSRLPAGKNTIGLNHLLARGVFQWSCDFPSPRLWGWRQRTLLFVLSPNICPLFRAIRWIMSSSAIRRLVFFSSCSLFWFPDLLPTPRCLHSAGPVSLPNLSSCSTRL